MDQGLKERLIGAAVLAALAVWLVPWLLDGPDEPLLDDRPALELPVPSGHVGELRTEIIDLSPRRDASAAPSGGGRGGEPPGRGRERSFGRTCRPRRRRGPCRAKHRDGASGQHVRAGALGYGSRAVRLRILRFGLLAFGLLRFNLLGFGRAGRARRDERVGRLGGAGRQLRPGGERAPSCRPGFDVRLFAEDLDVPSRRAGDVPRPHRAAPHAGGGRGGGLGARGARFRRPSRDELGRARPMLTWADYAIIITCVASAAFGLWRGFVKEAFSLVAWLAAIFLAWKFAWLLDAKLGQWIADPGLRLWVARAVILILVLIAGGLVGWVVRTLVHTTGLGGMDRLLGGAFGLARGVLIVGLAVIGLELAGLDGDRWWQKSRLRPLSNRVAEGIRYYGSLGSTYLREQEIV